ncbi:2-methylcitrate dehydratase PrpD [Herbaspirillum sp. Sphag1AN]|uniref:MmgE/PrpD family protein n=1 Tax=unclassified Herbaspirillum TaxID=2624150 RepID=UPI00160C4C0D|nr:MULTISPECIES: MmgE/PrpD family protein [unclassified Herbaspirillum]MBB3210809.1 2-methylcitrate dehydratase PrpD [Herbaspirillum sp. Sphag1AN]MBB3244439.1 2-methylcitrate dehydratase PrpD [Herbaspirillum sp. Sphag64]
MDLSRILAAWCADDRKVFPDSAMSRAEAAIADVVGCLLGGRHDPAVVGAGKIVQGDGPSGSASAVTHTWPVTAPWAALINGCAAHALDFDDNFFPPVTHASAVLVPALFALAEEIDTSTHAIVKAYIAGLEVESQIGKLVNPSHYESGWHATSTIGTIGAAAACAVLMQLDEEGVLHAISIGSSLASGSKRQFGSMVKPMHAGFAAMHGVLAAKLAASGISGVENTLQGKWSFEELYAGGNNFGTFTPSLFPDSPLAIDEYGLVAKLYPSCMSSHLGIDAMLVLSSLRPIDLTQISSIDLHLPEFMIANLRYQEPANAMEARFSMNYCAAVALVHGIPRISHFDEAALADPQVARLLPLVHMHVRETLPETATLPWGGDCLASISFLDGSVMEHRAIYPKGCQQNPLTPTQQRDKFIDCANTKVRGMNPAALFEKLINFARLDSLREVTVAMRA